MNVALLGFGHVGRAVARLVLDRHADRLTLTHIFNRNVARKRVPAATWSRSRPQHR